jgi:hypothetical protein
VLSPWAGRLKEPLLVKYDPRNLSRIYVQDRADGTGEVLLRAKVFLESSMD